MEEIVKTTKGGRGVGVWKQVTITLTCMNVRTCIYVPE